MRIPEWLEGILILFFAIIVMYGILSRAGTLASGYHFADDHELIRIEKAFQDGTTTLGQAVVAYMRNDLHWRYRPLYWAERVIVTYFFGSDLYPWNCYTMLKGILAFCLLYWMSRRMRYNRIISALVPCVIMLGAQFTPWFRSANQENTGLLLAAFTFWLIAAQAYYGKFRSWPYNLFIVWGGVSCGLVKESFTLIMPVFILLKFWLEYCDERKTPEKGHFLRCLKGNLIPCGLISLAMLVNVGMILFRVGVDKVSYAGFNSETALWEYKRGILSSVFQHTKTYTDIGILLLLLAVMCYRNVNRAWLRKYGGLILISGCAMAVQLVGHAKSGMWERYMIPYTVLYVFLFIFALYPLFEKDQVHRMVFYAAMLWLVGSGVRTAYDGAVRYAEDGRNVSLFFEEVCAQTVEDDEILCAFYDDELNLSSECWLEVHGRSVAYSWTNGAVENKVQLAGGAGDSFDLERVGAVLCYGWQKEAMLELLGLEEGEETGAYLFGNYLLLIKGDR
ncbi:MAG: hypothetical protein NC432_08530 [Roseburia sp.]|nr:hypothetical protein [Roseburia sp.]MCM1099071.1 hypothetical protein [Ruminococcus flavefaciens]